MALLCFSPWQPFLLLHSFNSVFWIKNSNLVKNIVRFNLIFTMPNILRSDDPVTSENFNLWLTRQNSNTLFLKNAKGLRIDTSNLFKNIVSSLFTGVNSIHSLNSYHGNLLLDLEVDGDLVVINRNFVEEGGRSLYRGMVKDITDVMLLVKLIVTKYCRSNHLPHNIMLFFKLFEERRNIMQHRNEDELRRFTYFLFNNPIIWKSLERFMFFQKSWNLKRMKIVFFENNVHLHVHPTDMTGWCLRFNNSSIFYNIWYSGERRLDTNFALDFWRHSIAHYQDEKHGKQETKLGDIELQLFKLFYDLCPKLFFAIIRGLWKVSRNVYIDDLYTFYTTEPVADLKDF